MNDADADGQRSAVTGKLIKMKVKKSSGDKEVRVNTHVVPEAWFAV